MTRFLKVTACVFLTALIVLFGCSGMAASVFKWRSVPDQLRPGKGEQLILSATGTGITVKVLDKKGAAVAILAENATAEKTLILTWDGGDLPKGSYTLSASMGKKNVKKKIRIGDPAPRVTELDAGEEMTDSWIAEVVTDTAGKLVLSVMRDGQEKQLMSVSAEPGRNTLEWDGTCDGARVTDGEVELILRLIDSTGFSSIPENITVTVTGHPVPTLATDVERHQPNEQSPVLCDHDDSCYWRMNLGETDEAAVWRVLTAPITVLKGDQRNQIAVREKPEADCGAYTGVVTCDSQGVHVLEKGPEWSLIEAYSSAEEDTRVPVFAKLFQGYVKTELLEKKQVDQHYGLVVDKLQQRLYVYRDGKLFTTMLCSTGFAREETPFHETPAGEFVIVSWTGGFWSGDLYCNYGLRINKGILLHEVPCKEKTDKATGETVMDYSRCERYLGEKASHGCIRIQRELTPEKVNMKWLWDNLSRNPCTKVLIWDDAGRILDYPDDEVPLYYNPSGGKYYHSAPDCALVSSKFWPLTAFNYSELDERPYSKLTPCPGCAPQLRREAIDTLNRKNKR